MTPQAIHISGGSPICTQPKEDAESKGQFFVFANYFGAKAIVHSLALRGRISAVCLYAAFCAGGPEFDSQVRLQILL